MNKELVEKMTEYVKRKTKEHPTGKVIGINERQVIAFCAECASEHYGDKWVKVDDVLPEVSPANKDVSVNVLVIEQGEQYIGWYSFDLGYWVEAIECVPMYKATHWMPLPQPPQK